MLEHSHAGSHRRGCAAKHGHCSAGHDLLRLLLRQLLLRVLLLLLLQCGGCGHERLWHQQQLRLPREEVRLEGGHRLGGACREQGKQLCVRACMCVRAHEIEHVCRCLYGRIVVWKCAQLAQTHMMTSRYNCLMVGR